MSVSAEEFRSSYLPPLPDDPFGDAENIFCFDNPNLGLNHSPSSSAVSGLDADPHTVRTQQKEDLGTGDQGKGRTEREERSGGGKLEEREIWR